jgi:hypothetical protein
MMRANRLAGLALASGVLGLLSTTAWATRINVDFDGDAFPATGEIFGSADTHFGANSSGTMPFALDFGSGATVYDFCFNSNGFVSFVASGSGCTFGSTPTGDYIAPFASALTTGGNTLWGSGSVDSSTPYSTSDTTPAIRFIWDATDSSNNAVLAELLLVSQPSISTGAFSLEYRYGNDLFGVDGAPATGSQGYKLGNNTSGPTSGPFATDTTYKSTFSAGAPCTTDCGGGTGTPPTDVPEPGALALLSGVLLLVPVVFRRRLRVGLLAQ